MTSATVKPSFRLKTIEKAVKGLHNLSPKVKRKVTSALYWIREPRQMMMEGYRSDILKVFAGYWNAFECLVETICILRPPTHNKNEEQRQIDEFIASRNGKLDAAAIIECDHIVDHGFVIKACYALHQCFPDRADQYIEECFKKKPKKDSLYNIRNAINHSNIDAGNLEE